jgi:UDP-N-acetylglucosamine 4,6-dehydratase/5-epimerase
MNILITGAGFLAQNLVKNLVKNKEYNKIIIYSRSWEKHLKIQSQVNDKRIRYFVGDIRNLERLDLAMKDVDICIHTAALKDLKSCEYNINECISNNIYGSENIVKSAIKNKVKKALLISTDKAVNPQNAYGISKLMAEKLFINANALSANREIRFEVTRYGNVFGSTGSVLDLWLNLIKNGIYEIPITHSDMTRYFMNIKEAINLIISSIAQNNYYHIPLMRKFKIMDLFFSLQDLIENNLSFKIIGKKYGEKIYEEIQNNENCANGPFMSIQEIKSEIINNELWRYMGFEKKH